MISLKKLNLFSQNLPISSIDCVIKIGDRFLLIKRKKWPAKNKFTFTGSIVQKNISIKKSIQKLIKREIGLTINSSPKLLGVRKFIFSKNFIGNKDKIEYISQIYLIKISKKNIKNIDLDSDHSEFIFLNKKELIKNKNVINQIKKFVKNTF